jgi:serine/threonine protein kinase
VAIVCPNCTNRLNLKAPKPGRYRPRCPRCGNSFVLVVPEGADPVVEVRASLPADTMPRPSPSKVLPAGRLLAATEAMSGESPCGVAVADSPLPGSQLVPARRADATPPPVAATAEHVPLKVQVRGYEIERELGRGGMGSVYLARQLSLDRPVALKIMSKRWATDPVFVARFTREAYAAAQLSHPNIVQIHDIGEVDGTRFFSMEYVRGQSLADLVRSRGKLDPETAVGYILQAARGLKHAHDRGMIHRDVKPDNLLLDDSGLVKVADLGLVKTGNLLESPPRPGSRPDISSDADLNLTGVRIALGTPAYMSPEQCRDAALVDHRADIYSLGCTLYVLVTGRPPFDGTTAMELMTKQAYDPLVPPEQIVSRVPKEISAVIQRMMAKNADDRFQSMDEVIRTLETWLGVLHAGTFTPYENQIAKLESYVVRFNTAPAAVFRRRLVEGFFGTLVLAAVLTTFFGKLTWALGLVGLGVQASLAYFLLDGVARRGPLFTRTRHFLLGLSWGDWAVVVAGLALFGLLLGVLGIFWLWAGFGLAGVCLAFALRWGVDRAAGRQRHGAVEGAERLVRRLRTQGLDEDEIHQFVAKFAGRDWEEFFEALFGYEAKLAARAVLLRGNSAGVREKHAAWREPLIALMDQVERARRAAREQQLLVAVERAKLLAAGAAPEVADRKAREAADAMVNGASRVREAEGQPDHADQPPVNVHEAVIPPECDPFGGEAPPRDPLAQFVGLFVGPHVRTVLAAVLLAGFGLWVYQNGLLPGGEVKAQAKAAVENRDLSGLQQTAASLPRPTRPLEVAGLPDAATNWVDGCNAGFAGLLLFGSLIARGNVMAAFVLLGAAVAAVGHQHGICTVEPFRAEHIAMLLGGSLALVGFRLGR